MPASLWQHRRWVFPIALRSTTVTKKIAGNGELEAAFAAARERVAKILTQKADSTDKLYALHAPEVECIAKARRGRATSSG